MALRLVRQTSDTPNLTNKDDTIMTRYAYGGYNGVVKAFGNECGYTADNGIFKVLDGRIVIDGWEIDIDGAGVLINLSNVIGTQYRSVYVEINVATETVIINSTYLSNAYPTIDKGDDLTSTPNGTARLLLYNVRVENGAITEVVKRFNLIPYLTSKVLDIERRLEELGFKKGVAEYNNYTVDVTANSLKKQGKYVIFNFAGLGAGDVMQAQTAKIIIPQEFRPSKETEVFVFNKTIYANSMKYPLKPDGIIEIVGTIEIINAGWETE